MKLHIPGLLLAVFALAALPSPCAHAQASPTASRGLQIFAFAGGSGVYTGLTNGKNLDVTAGVDVGFRTFFGLRPSLEVRGSYPVDDNGINNEKSVLGGLKVAKNFGRIRPYADILFGRGEIDYIGGAINSTQTVEYLENPTNVLSPGVGVDLGLTENFSLKADLQYQRFNTPVTASGTIYSKPITVGVVYRINFDRSHHSSR